MATLKNTTITGTDGLTIPRGSSGERLGDSRKNYVVETFTSTGASSWTCPSGVTEIELLIVGGGGAGSRAHTTNTCGGGGAGGVVYKNAQPVSPGTTYTVTVGAGGTGTTAGANALGGSGSSSSFVGGSVNLVGLGGGRGAGSQTGGFPNKTSTDGGSGGGAGSYDQVAGNSRPFEGSFALQPSSASGGFGHDGGNVGHTDGNYTGGGGGGGAGGPGSDGIRGTSGNTNGVGGAGGPGLAFNITGQTVWYAGGGGGSGWQHSRPGAGGIGGGARGGSNSGQAFGDVTPATANTGGGGGGAKSNTPGNTGGGSGIVVIRYSNPDAADAEDVLGAIRYNEDFKELEVYNQDEGWIAQDNRKNWAGHNTLLYSSLIGTSGVTKYAATDTLTTAAATAPNGKQEASQFSGNGSTSTRHYLGFLPNTYLHDSNSKYTFSIFVKARGSTRYVELETRSYSTYTNPGGVVFDLQEGVAINPNSYLLPRIVYYGDGWYRLSMTATTNGGGSGSGFYINYCTDENATKNGVVLGTADGYFIWGMQDNKGASPDPYTPITDTPTPPAYTYEGWRIHKFVATGTASFVPACTGKVEVLVVAGGGAGGNCSGNGGTPAGGGGAGGLIHVKDFEVTSGEVYNVTVGAGAPQNTTNFVNGEQGDNSRFGDLVAYGGGGGGGDDSSVIWGTAVPGRRRGWVGGSGGGASRTDDGGVGVLGQGNRGGGSYRDPAISGYTYASHANGGGGAGTVGGMGFGTSADGGNGVEIDITGERVYYAGGGAGGGYNGVGPGKGGLGGGGSGASYTGAAGAHADPGEANTGGGGGGGAANGSTANTSHGGAGGSGIVVVRYKVG